MDAERRQHLLSDYTRYGLTDLIEELEAQIAEAQADAKRYRWIRENHEWRRYGNLPDEDSYAFVGCRFPYLANFGCKTMLDYNIDQMCKSLAGKDGE